MKKLGQDSSTSAMSALHNETDSDDDARVTSYHFSYKGVAGSPDAVSSKFFNDHSPPVGRLSDVGPHIRSSHQLY